MKFFIFVGLLFTLGCATTIQVPVELTVCIKMPKGEFVCCPLAGETCADRDGNEVLSPVEVVK